MVTLGRGINWIIDNHQLSDPLSCYPMSCGMLHCLVYIWFVQSCLLLCLYSILPSTAHFMHQCQWCSWHWVIETNVTVSPWNWISEVHIARHVYTQRHQLENLAFVTLFGSMSSCQLDATEALVRVKVEAHTDPPTKYIITELLSRSTRHLLLGQGLDDKYSLGLKEYDKDMIRIEYELKRIIRLWWRIDGAVLERVDPDPGEGSCFRPFLKGRYTPHYTPKNGYTLQKTDAIPDTSVKFWYALQ